jgi:O-antigen biosynthesis protein WbqP
MKSIRSNIESLFALAILFFLLPVLLLISIYLRIRSSDPIIHWSKRVGLNNKLFLMPKFRTMKLNTPDLASNLLKNPDVYITYEGYFLRKYSLDELPQLWSIVVGDMTFVGPRPALFNQHNLIRLRTLKGIHSLKPGITGLAQVNGRDNLSIINKVKFDEEYLKKKSLFLDIEILLTTFMKIIQRDGIHH